jgi:hypothetical protein
MEPTFARRPRWRRRSALLATAPLLAALIAACSFPGRPPRTTTTTSMPGGPTTTGTTIPGGGGGSLPLTSNVDADGPFPTTVDGRAGANSTVFRPTTLGQNGIKHPIFVWGVGGGSQPSSYNFHFRRLASHGFVIISPNSANTTGAQMKAALDWIYAQNTAPGSVFNGKLNTGKIGMGGHSMGSIATFAAEQNETRLTTTIHVAGGSFDGRGSSGVRTPTAYICGETDFARSNCERDFRNVGSQPTFFSILRGTDHIMAARNGLPGIHAWLRWHLNGETDRRAQFSPGGTYFSGIWQSQVKNWG